MALPATLAAERQGQSLARYFGKRAVLYGRVSTVIQETDGYSLGSQRDGGRKIAALARMRVVVEDFEQGSGQDWDLAGINRIVQRAKRGEFDVLVLKNVSRLSRKRGKQAWLEHELERAGVEILYYDEPYDDTAAGRLQRGIMAEVAEFQVEQARELSMAERYRKVKHFGRPVGNGQTPYGWRRVFDDSGTRRRTVGYEHDPAESSVIRRFLDLRTVPTTEFCARLNAEGIPSPGKWRPTEKRPRSGRWTNSSIWHVLNSRMTWGEYRYGERALVKHGGKARVIKKQDATVYTLQLPPILTRAEVADIKAALASRKRRGGALRGTESDPYTLRLALTCGLCGATLATQQPGKHDPWRLYTCLNKTVRYAERGRDRRCTLPSLIAVRSPKRPRGDGIEEVAERLVRSVLFDEANLREAVRRSREETNDVGSHAERLTFLRSLIKRKTTALERVTMKWAEAEDDIELGSFEAARHELTREIASLRDELAALEAYVPAGITNDEEAAVLALASKVRKGTDHATPTEWQFIYRALGLRGVVVLDPEGAYQIGRHRYEIEWTGYLDFSPYLETGNAVRKFVNFEDFGRRIARAPFQVEGGYIQLPTTPGLGIDLDEEALQAHPARTLPPRNIRQFSDEGP